ncbi:WD40/YVTN/BNR-like repeat-containing protein [Stutzerimonas kunmingensis]|uniref:WD40/YVTN/BNR-like repeat-containing protein n=1 Tax=Stutzerimonas kunmingensis TaxID=1211807 RepID=UPI0028970ED6|nr:hypothetical protein [Stutzerimonas kunmingensis]
MTVPVITPLPPAPTRADAPSDFTAKADAFVAAQVGMVAEFNASAGFVDQRAIDAAASATAAADSATTASQHEQGAADQAALASTARQGAEDAEQQAQLYAAAAGASAGVPALTGNAGKSLVVKSDESGVEWGSASQSIGDILVTARDPGPTFLAADGGIYLQSAYPELFPLIGLTTDALDAPWSSVSAGMTYYDGGGVATDGEGTWIVGGRNGSISRSVDNGATWAVISGIGTATFTGLSAGGNGVWVIIAGSSAYRSTDNGATWTSVTTGLTGATYGVASDGNGVWVAGGYNGGMARSTDNGLTWGLVSSGIGANQIYAVDTDRAGIWVAGGQNGIMARSTDNGATWSSVTSGFGTQIIYDIATDNSGVWLAVGGGGIVSRSADNGATWAAVTSGFGTTIIKGCATDGYGVWYAGGSSTLRVSKDNGLTWGTASAGVSNLDKIAAGNDRTWVLNGSQAVARLFPYTYDPTTQFKLVSYPVESAGLTPYIKALEAVA